MCNYLEEQNPKAPQSQELVKTAHTGLLYGEPTGPGPPGHLLLLDFKKPDWYSLRSDPDPAAISLLLTLFVSQPESTISHARSVDRASRNLAIGAVPVSDELHQTTSMPLPSTCIQQKVLLLGNSALFDVPMSFAAPAGCPAPHWKRSHSYWKRNRRIPNLQRCALLEAHHSVSPNIALSVGHLELQEANRTAAKSSVVQRISWNGTCFGSPKSTAQKPGEYAVELACVSLDHKDQEIWFGSLFVGDTARWSNAGRILTSQLVLAWRNVLPLFDPLSAEPNAAQCYCHKAGMHCSVLGHCSSSLFQLPASLFQLPVYKNSVYPVSFRRLAGPNAAQFQSILLPGSSFLYRNTCVQETGPFLEGFISPPLAVLLLPQIGSFLKCDNTVQKFWPAWYSLCATNASNARRGQNAPGQDPANIEMTISIVTMTQNKYWGTAKYLVWWIDSFVSQALRRCQCSGPRTSKASHPW
jgi:hypothetical protein